MLSSDFQNQDDFELFKEVIAQPLPTAFRINPTSPNAQKIVQILENQTLMDEYFFQNHLADKEEQEEPQDNPLPSLDPTTDTGTQEGDQTPKKDHYLLKKQVTAKRAQFYPNGYAFHLNVSRRELKKCKRLKRMHKFLQVTADCGLVTRQELVSMLPPLFLDIQPNDLILDMCAAPGSKTTQILEFLAKSGNLEGGVLANDVNKKRAFMLTRQMKRISFPGMGVVNHEGQFLPTIYDDSDLTLTRFDRKIYFNKVLVDVPCSGDGAIRKLPIKWREWSAKEAIDLHGIQKKLLKRALQLVEVGGIVVYSTCSMNPVENEAVVASVMGSVTVEGCLELLDPREMVDLKDFKTRAGLSKWSLLVEKEGDRVELTNQEGKEYATEDLFRIFDQYEDGLKEIDNKIEESMFPLLEAKMDAMRIDRAMRVLPHDQDTGGFFLAVIRKKSLVYFENQKKRANLENKETKNNVEDAKEGNEASEEQGMEDIGVQALLESKNQSKTNIEENGGMELEDGLEDGEGSLDGTKEAKNDTKEPLLEGEFHRIEIARPDDWQLIQSYYDLDEVKND